MLELYRVIGAKIRDERSKKNLSQEEIARRLNLSRSSVTNIENGNQKISVLDLYKLAETLNVDITDLLPTKRDLSHTPKPAIEKIDSDSRFSSKEKKELKQIVQSLQGGE